MSIIYLASPYSHENEDVMLDRFNAVCEYAAKLMMDGLHIYSPIAHCHPIAQFGLPTDWGYWQEFDKRFISVSSKLIVYKLDGWEESKGISAEIQIAEGLNIPVEYHDVSN